MRIHTSSRIIATICLVVVAMLGVAMVTALKYNENKTQAGSSQNAATRKTASSKSVVNSNTTTKNPSGNTSDADQHVADATKDKPATVACDLLTIGIAKQILGNDANLSSVSDTSSLQVSDTIVTACGYSGKNGNVQLIIRTPVAQLGDSVNDTEFGSGKPTNTTAVQGYGDTAYWNPGNHTLNILGSNNWYIISRSTNTQAGAVTVATLLSSGF